MSTKAHQTPGTWLRQMYRPTHPTNNHLLTDRQVVAGQAAKAEAHAVLTRREQALGAHVAALLERQRLAAPTPMWAPDAGWMR